LDLPPEISGENALPVIVADLFQSGSFYHTIRHPIRTNFQHEILWRDQLWNLPTPYRPGTAKQHSDISDWLEELCWSHLSASQMIPRNEKEDWNSLQLLLHFLNKRKSYNQAKLSVELTQLQDKSRQVLYRRLDKDEKEKRVEAGENVYRSRGRAPTWLASTCSTKGDSDEPNYQYP